MKLPIHMVCSCKFVRADVCVVRFVVNLSVNRRSNFKLDFPPSCSRGMQNADEQILQGILQRSYAVGKTKICF